jgi:3-deoxy-D-manno-octulosonate 8-phosphate phosphatase (KDO 8-P phosphatase)
MSPDEVVTDRLRRIRLILTDVDGVLTDGRIARTSKGEELKFFSIRDGLGIRLAQQGGLEVGFLSGRRCRQVAARAQELGVCLVVQGCEDKWSAFSTILAERGLLAEEAAYVGDDLPDLRVLAQAGLAVAPADGVAIVRAAAHFVTSARGGHGVIRELVEAVLQAQGKWSTLLKAFGNHEP